MILGHYASMFFDLWKFLFAYCSAGFWERGNLVCLFLAALDILISQPFLMQWYGEVGHDCVVTV